VGPTIRPVSLSQQVTAWEHLGQIPACFDDPTLEQYLKQAGERTMLIWKVRIASFLAQNRREVEFFSRVLVGGMQQLYLHPAALTLDALGARDSDAATAFTCFSVDKTVTAAFGSIFFGRNDVNL